MYNTYHCGKNPNVICSAASHGAIETPCDSCCEWKTELTIEKKVKTFIVVADSYYLKRSLILNPSDKEIPLDTDSNDFTDVYMDNNNWKYIHQDAYLGYYKWSVNDVEGLKAYVGKKHGLNPITLSAYAIDEN